MDLAEKILWIINLLLVLLLVLRLTNNRLYRVYTWFFILLCFQACQTVGMMPLSPLTNIYAYVYFATQPVMLLLYILAVLELYSVALQQHRGIASFSRWVLLGAMLLSVAISALTIPADLSRPVVQLRELVYYGVVERGLMFSLVLFLMVITGFLLWTPLAIRRNIVLHAVLYSAYFLASAAALFIRNNSDYSRMVPAASIAMLAVNNACLLLWFLFLNKRGEVTLLRVRRAWQPQDEIRLAHQIDAVNAFLLKSSKK